MTNYLRTSERNLFKRCQWAWERNYIDQIEPANPHSPALWFGTGIHLALEKWYIPGTERGANLVETWEAYCDESAANTTYINTYMDGDFSEAVEAKELGTAMLNAYQEEYGKEEWMDVIAAEFPFQVPIKHLTWDNAGDPRETTSYYVGTMDLVYRDTRDGKLYVMDHKTAKALGSSNTQYLPLDDQAGSYWAAAVYVLRKANLIGPKERLEGIVYNYLVKAKPDTRPRNKEGFATNNPQKKHYAEALKSIKTEKPLDKYKVDELKSIAEANNIEVFGEVSARQPSKNFDRVIVRKNPRQQKRQIERMVDDFQAMDIVRNGVVAVTKTPTRECSFCAFRDLCEIDEAGMDYTDMKEMLYKKWDPYKAHREEEK